MRGVGKTLIASGVLIFLFVAYQLWGTGLAERRDQRALRDQFAQRLSTVPSTAPGGPPPTAAAPIPGDAIALLRVPKLGLEKAVVEGVGVEDLKKAPGHYPDTPMPGEKGNSAIAGHRTTYGAPFGDLDKLEPGDPILLQTQATTFRYEVDHLRIVDPSESWVLDDAGDDRLTLTTCHPKFSAAQRMIVVAKLTSPGTVATAPAVGTPPTDPPTTEAPRPRSERADGLAGLSGERAARGPAVAWGTATALVWLLAWVAGRRWNRWLVYLAATPVFLVALFVFFENFSRLLPANV
ncbi:MAG TPA: class E sortase [Acidimicrobiales bacterium]|nr:class E sortase [Acidimicrobiales bacterium]